MLADEKRLAAAAGSPPRYSGRCRSLTDREIASRAGMPYTLRFRVDFAEIRIRDLIHREIAFSSDAFGDFVIVRADGSGRFHLLQRRGRLPHGDHPRHPGRRPPPQHPPPDTHPPRPRARAAGVCPRSRSWLPNREIRSRSAREDLISRPSSRRDTSPRALWPTLPRSATPP